jgi:hypothetical protein
MGMNFRNYLTVVESGGGAFLGSDFTGSEAPDTMSLSGHTPHLPSIDLALPSLTRHGQITIMLKNQNPIYVQLNDGTKLFFTIDEFKRIKGFPEIGRTMTVTFQRHHNDISDMPSKIDSCTVS